LKTQVYSFAMIVFVYLGATFAGSLLYRYHLRNARILSVAKLVALLTTAVFLPVLVNDPRMLKPNWIESTVTLSSAILLLASIFPFCALLGYLTPRLIDDCAAGDPADAGKVYAVNVLGCILGPLFACYILLPALSEKMALLLLALFCVGYYLFRFKS